MGFLRYFALGTVLSIAATMSTASELVGATPQQVPGANTVDVAAAKQLFDQEAAFVDLRKENVWNGGRIPGAMSLEASDQTARAATNISGTGHELGDLVKRFEL